MSEMIESEGYMRIRVSIDTEGYGAAQCSSHCSRDFGKGRRRSGRYCDRPRESGWLLLGHDNHSRPSERAPGDRQVNAEARDGRYNPGSDRRVTRPASILSLSAMIRPMGMEEDREERTWTTKEAAGAWGVTPGRVRQWYHEGRIVAYKRAGTLFIPKHQNRPADLRHRKPR